MSDDTSEQKRSHGPGFRLGLLIGIIAGLAAAVLFAPPTGEGEPRVEGTGVAEPAEFDAGSPAGRAMSLVEQVRARVQEAAREAEIARREAEQAAMARYTELTKGEHSGGE